VWEAVVQRFEEGADVFFASAASISLGRWALPVYEIYKAGSDPFWEDGLDLLSYYGLNVAVVPHFDDQSGGENYDSRFCYMGARVSMPCRSSCRWTLLSSASTPTPPSVSTEHQRSDSERPGRHHADRRRR
jgi:hypothetical protein